MSTATYKIYVDWDNNGNYTGIYDDISADVMEIPKIMQGKDKQLGHAQAGILELRLKDLAHKYSPENNLSPLHDKLLPYRPIKVMATFAEEDYDLFNGFISKIVPHPHWAKQDAYIYALDGMDWLAKGIISTKIIYSGIWNICPGVNDGYPCLVGITPSCI